MNNTVGLKVDAYGKRPFNLALNGIPQSEHLDAFAILCYLESEGYLNILIHDRLFVHGKDEIAEAYRLQITDS